ncbi:UNVERIFIED_CONTAM: hypothetical protein H355_015264, partial [Colinus virginianus]
GDGGHRSVPAGRTGHAEVVRVVFDPHKISYEELLRAFWENHDPTQGMQQYEDVGTQYRSIILTLSPQQQEAALRSRDAYQRTPPPPPTMKAISPVRSVRSCYEAVCCLSEQSLAIARSSNNKSPALEEPMNLLYDMNDCYSKLRELVPGIPQGTKLSQVEILQHVIDYIFDLQIVLEEGAKGRDPSSEATLLSLKAA